MKRITLVTLFCVLACYLHQTSAQQNWWERLPNGTTTIASSRTTTTTTTTTATPSSAANTTTTAAPDCGCLSTLEYNPVCGDNRVTYDNPGKLECAQRCGQNVQLLFYGRCQRVS